MKESRHGFYFIFLQYLCLQGQFSAAGAAAPVHGVSAKTAVADSDSSVRIAIAHSFVELEQHNLGAGLVIANGSKPCDCFACGVEYLGRMWHGSWV